MKKTIVLFLIIALLAPSFSLFAQDGGPTVRLKDISRILEARDNQLMGFGLVIGLRNSGDSKNTVFTDAALTNMLKKIGLPTGPKEFSSRNVAAVMVTATLPPFIKKGQKLSVTVSSLGDSTSLVGGTLIITPLQGVNGKIYAVAQGTVLVGGLDGSSQQGRLYRNETTVGRIPEGAIVEDVVPVTFTDQHNITIVMHNSNFITVSRATKAIQDNGFPGAKAIDANMIKVPLSDLNSSDLVSTIAKLENIAVVPDSSSKIVVNSRTGTVVIGDMVRLFPVAVTHGNISIRISDSDNGGLAALQGGGAQEPIRVDEPQPKIIFLNPNSTLSSLVNALNEIGASPKDLISILQALKESGSLIGDLEVL
ncbi:MAG: flagellar basal body P-ring protein FlgI [Candidatus Margulisiibacteriota bacterium]